MVLTFTSLHAFVVTTESVVYLVQMQLLLWENKHGEEFVNKSLCKSYHLLI